MSKQKQFKRSSNPAPQSPQSVKAVATRKSFFRKYAYPWTYILTFVLLWIFCSWIYGDVFRRVAESNFITADDGQMKFLTDQAWGDLYWYGRWVLLALKSQLLGGALLSFILTGIVFCADRLFSLPRNWRGSTILLPGLILGWMVWRGTNLYYKNEPSLVFIVPIAVLLLTAIGWGIKGAIRRFAFRNKKTVPAASKVSAYTPYGWIGVGVVFIGLTFSALFFNENEILTARMQIRTMYGDWEGLVDDGLSARRPSRAVAAYYAIGSLRQGQLLQQLFAIPYDFPDAGLDKKEGGEEYGLFLADCNFHAGLINASYRNAMDQVVMNGPSLYYLKRMAVCAIMNGEKALANKYLDIIGKVPFEGTFVEKYRPLANDETLVLSDPDLQSVARLRPQESRFEQQYRTPAFLGYNVGLLSGTDETLVTAIAACLYSKDIRQAMNYIRFYAQKHNGVMPVYVEQAVTILANTNPGVAQEYQAVVQKHTGSLRAFLTAATPLIKERQAESAGKSQEEQQRIKAAYNVKMREALKDDWMGTYFYYYYCENNNPDQVRKAENKGGVN